MIIPRVIFGWFKPDGMFEDLDTRRAVSVLNGKLFPSRVMGFVTVERRKRGLWVTEFVPFASRARS